MRKLLRLSPTPVQLVLCYGFALMERDENVPYSTKNARKRAAFEWKSAHDAMLVIEILMVEPYKYKPSTPNRGAAWTQIAEILNSCTGLEFQVTQRSVGERFAPLEKSFTSKMNDQGKASGITPSDMTEVERGKEEILGKSNAAKENFSNDSKEKQAAIDADRKHALDMRKKAMERFADTKLQKCDDEESPKCKKSRSSGSDTLSFLREKADRDEKRRTEELELKRESEKRLAEDSVSNRNILSGLLTTQQQMMQHLSQQQQQQETMMSLFMQQEQEQLRAFSSLIGQSRKDQ